ncbi:MAG TPA: alanine--glyoxylate aminotransferase family protein [Actinomycetota bacterium]|nr:alanine--glyoxylate aminotransferase family protein [Actinomycetota bacterium]
MSRPLLGHLDPDFLSLMDEVRTMLRQAFRTSNETTFAVSGTGSAGMEAALVNLLEPGDVAVVGIAGVFGERMADVARRCGAQVREVRAEWGAPLEPAQVEPLLEGAKVVSFVHAETSTGMRQPVEALSAMARDAGAMVVLDAVTSLAGLPVEVDAWGVDVCYSGTQKCLSVPPGLAPVTFSPRAVEAIAARTTPVQSWYLDVSMLTRYWGSERVYHHTAPISMLFGLHEGLRLVLDEGLETRWARHGRLGAVLSKELDALGFEQFAREGFRLPQLQAVRLPEGRDADALRRALLDRFDVEVGGGLGPLAGNAWRIGLMGESCHEDAVEFLLEAIREVLD